MNPAHPKIDHDASEMSVRSVRACLEGEDDNALRALVRSVSQSREAALLKTLNYAIETRLFTSGAKKVAKVFVVPFLVKAQGVADFANLDVSAISATVRGKIGECCGAADRDLITLHSRMLPLESLRQMPPRQLYELAGLLCGGPASERGVNRMMRDAGGRVEDNWLMIDGSYYFMGAMVGALIGNQGRSKFTLGSELPRNESERISRYASLLTAMLLEAQAPELGDLSVTALAPHGLCSGIPAASLLLCRTYAQAIVASGAEEPQVCVSPPSGESGGKLVLKFLRPEGAEESFDYPWSVYDQRHQWEIANSILKAIGELGAECKSAVSLQEHGIPVVRH